jgi:hypothetical protein
VRAYFIFVIREAIFHSNKEIEIWKILSLTTGRSHMKKFLTILAALTVVATPALAQSHGAPVTGTESNQEENHVGYYASNFGSQNDHIAVRQSGLNAFAMVPHAQSWLRGRSSSHGWW